MEKEELEKSMRGKNHSDSETTDSDTEDEEANIFQDENLVIISSNERINMLQWGEHLEENWDRLMKENTRLLVLAGVHGKEDGKLGGNEIRGKDNFVEDSKMQVGRLTKKFMEDIKKKNINFEVRDIGSHRKRYELDEDKFVSAVREFHPTMILLAFCWSHKSELNDLLRAAGIYSTLILREDLAQISESRHVHLDKDQRNLVKKVAEEEPKNVFLWGTSGSGKTLLAAECLKMKVSQLWRQGKQNITVLVSSMHSPCSGLLKDLEKKYLPDIKSDKKSFMGLDDLAETLGVSFNLHNPQRTLENILSGISAKNKLSSSHTILLVDEVAPVHHAIVSNFWTITSRFFCTKLY